MKAIKEVGLDLRSPHIPVKELSGGERQGVAIARSMYFKSKMLILDEPTRGIDVGAKFEIYTLINNLVDKGMSIIMISSELPELLAMSDRVYVVAEGVVTGELSKKEATQENVMRLATL